MRCEKFDDEHVSKKKEISENMTIQMMASAPSESHKTVLFCGTSRLKFSVYVPDVCAVMQHPDRRAEAASLSVYLFI